MRGHTPIEADVIVIGSGGAGGEAAIHAELGNLDLADRAGVVGRERLDVIAGDDVVVGANGDDDGGRHSEPGRASGSRCLGGDGSGSIGGLSR